MNNLLQAAINDRNEWQAIAEQNTARLDACRAERDALAAATKRLVELHHSWTRGRASLTVEFERQNDEAIAAARAALSNIGA